MKNVKTTVAFGDLNTGISVNVFADIKTNIFNVTRRRYPKEILIINNSGDDLGFILLGNDKEIAEFALELATPGAFPYYDLIPVADGAGISNAAISRAKQIYIKSDNGLATTDIDLYLLDYSKGGS